MSTAPQTSLVIEAPVSAEYAAILSPEACAFVAALQRKFNPRRLELLNARAERQKRIDAGELPDFLAETAHVRAGNWTVAPIPADLADRRTEITGPVDRKMIINALNSGASMFMADLEDSNSPTWDNIVGGQINLRDAVRGDISFSNPDGKKYKLVDKPAVLLVRPRGWHLVERHVLVDGEVVSGSLFDFGLYLFHNARALMEKGSGPYFYLPKMQSHLEARLWNDVFVFGQEYVGVPKGTIRATVLIETILAAFEMDEILFELKDHSAGLNCGRWDYIFSFIKVLRNHPSKMLPDRSQVTMDKAFLKSYVDLLIQTCHKRGIHAMGGMAAQIPIKNDPAANDAALERVRQDKLREVKAGHDGTWLAHPGLIPIAKTVFDEYMKTPNQISVKREDVHVVGADLLKVHEGVITEQGLRLNVDVAIQYIESWLRGNGCVPIYNLMEDAATAEISRTQVWQWLRHGAKLNDGRQITAGMVKGIVSEMLTRPGWDGGKFPLAAELFEKLALSEDLTEFLTLEAYRYL